MMAASETCLPKYMKYKRRYYDTDNYTTRTLERNARSGTTEVSDGNKTATVMSTSLQSTDRQHKELSPCFSNERHCPPKKRHLVSGDSAPDTTGTADERHPATDSFLRNLENQQTTQEICVALLSMAFWRPEAGENCRDCQTETRRVGGGPKPDDTVGESSTCLQELNTVGSLPVMTGIKDRTPTLMYCQDHAKQLGVHDTHDEWYTTAEKHTTQYCEGDNGTTQPLSAVVDPVHSSVFKPKMDNEIPPSSSSAYILTEQQPMETHCSDDTGLYLGNITDGNNHDSQSLDDSCIYVNGSFIHSVNQRVQTSITSTIPITVGLQNKQDTVGIRPDPGIKSSGHPSHLPTVIAQLPSALCNSHDQSEPHNANTEFASHDQYSDSKQIADSPTSPEVSKILSLFPKPVRGRQLWEIVEIMARRHKEDYFIGWTADEIMDLTPDQRPNIFPVTAKLKKDYVSKSVMTENKKLAFSYYSNEEWGREFREKLRNGSFKTLSDAKHQASILWRIHCPEYDETRAVRMRDSNGKIIMKRTREKTGSEFEYRQRLRKAKMNTIVDQIWLKRTVIADLLSSENRLRSVILEIKGERANYTPPGDKATQLADAIAHKLIKELITVNNDRLL